jgi:leader peptidase (prepilin peptidase) / N-methyltransferase
VISKPSPTSAARLIACLVLVLVTGCDGGDPTVPPAEWPIVAMQVATVVWVFTIGASIGSFLNVVVYRLPLGLSLSSPPSRCPACGTWIERRDNVPVLGWLLLRGRCRACGVAISPRYPIVEATVGLLFVALLYVELASGGANLPVREPDASRGLVNTLWALRWDLIGLTLYHLFLLCSLLAAGLMAYDGRSIRRLLPTVLLVGLSLPLVWPWLRPVPAIVPRPEWMDRAWVLSGLLDGAAGAIAGFALGGLLALGIPPNEPRRRFNVLGMVLAKGVFLGWQGVVSAGVLIAGGWVVVAVAARATRIGTCPELVVFVAGVVQVVAWRTLSSWAWWPGPREPWTPLLGGIVVGVGTLLVRALTSREGGRDRDA